MADTTTRGGDARRLLSLPYPGDPAVHALRIAEAQTCAILAVADAIDELIRKIDSALEEPKNVMSTNA